MERRQVVGGDLGERFRRAVGAPGIGMIAVERLRHGDGGLRVRVVLRGADAGDELGADAVDRLLVETWLLHGQFEEAEGGVLLRGEHAHGAVDAVAVRIEAHLRPGVVELLLEGFAVKVAGAFVEEAGHQAGQSLLAVRVLRRAAAEGETNGDDRDGIILDQPGMDALRGDDILDGDGGIRPAGKHRQPAKDDESRKDAGHGGSAGGQVHSGRLRPHQFVPFSGGQFMLLSGGRRYPVTERVGSRYFAAASLTWSAVTALMRSGHSSTSLTVPPVASVEP